MRLMTLIPISSNRITLCVCVCVCEKTLLGYQTLFILIISRFILYYYVLVLLFNLAASWACHGDLKCSIM